MLTLHINYGQQTLIPKQNLRCWKSWSLFGVIFQAPMQWTSITVITVVQSCRAFCQRDDIEMDQPIYILAINELRYIVWSCIFARGAVMLMLYILLKGQEANQNLSQMFSPKWIKLFLLRILVKDANMLQFTCYSKCTLTRNCQSSLGLLI